MHDTSNISKQQKKKALDRFIKCITFHLDFLIAVSIFNQIWPRNVWLGLGWFVHLFLFPNDYADWQLITLFCLDKCTTAELPNIFACLHGLRISAKPIKHYMTVVYVLLSFSEQLIHLLGNGMSMHLRNSPVSKWELRAKPGLKKDEVMTITTRGAHILTDPV